MSKLAFVFPGQGAQRVGMAREFYDTCTASREVFEAATKAAGFSVEEFCFEENEKINQTRYTQPVLLTASLAILAAVKEAGISADMTAGLSLGEYCALALAGAFSVEDAVKIVCQRGIYMEEAVPTGGAMTAVLSRKPIPTEDICAAVTAEGNGVVTVANYNCPGQQVISGATAAVNAAAAKLLEAGASRAVPLVVSGPFHSPMLSGAGEKLAALLKDQEIAKPAMPVYSNVTAQVEAESEEIRDLLGKQVSSSVRRQQSVENMIAAGADTFVEIGPGTTLTNFMKKIDKTVKVFHVETPADLAALKEALAG